MGLPEDAGGGGASSLDLVLVAEIVVALDGDRLIAIRRPPGARPHVEPSPNFGSSPLADWRLAARPAPGPVPELTDCINDLQY